MSFLNSSFYFGIEFNFITDSPFIAAANENATSYPPVLLTYLITEDSKRYITEAGANLITESS